jgi:hypothetical protein
MSIQTTSKTSNEKFEKDGCLLVKNIWNAKDLFCEVPDYRGLINYHGKLSKFTHVPVESQVKGSLARYHYPPYKYFHSQIRKKIEKILGEELFNTYYYDRFYFPEQELVKHTDRHSCEISITINVSTNLNSFWPIFVESPSGENLSFSLKPGDGLIYKGCERPHWRNKMPSRYGKVQKFIRKFKNLEDDSYYHQVFFHYVLANGQRSHYANDVKH